MLQMFLHRILVHVPILIYITRNVTKRIRNLGTVHTSFTLSTLLSRDQAKYVY